MPSEWAAKRCWASWRRCAFSSFSLIRKRVFIGMTYSVSSPVACLRSNCVLFEDQRDLTIRDVFAIEEGRAEHWLAKQPHQMLSTPSNSNLIFKAGDQPISMSSCATAPAATTGLFCFNARFAFGISRWMAWPGPLVSLNSWQSPWAWSLFPSLCQVKGLRPWWCWIGWRLRGGIPEQCTHNSISIGMSWRWNLMAWTVFENSGQISMTLASSHSAQTQCCSLFNLYAIKRCFNHEPRKTYICL